ncbi:MAG: dienelactone hydrolase family protein [Porticoccus sp.]|nr:dienelactone hydrolase family protein [Porticoccus sp.]
MSYINAIKKTVRIIAFSSACLLILPLPQALHAEQKSNLESNARYIQLKTADQQSFTAYVAGPETAQQGILLIHGWWGLNREIETWANQFAVAGYRVMAIDLFDRQVATVPAEAKQLINAVEQSSTNEKYAAAIKALSAPQRKIAIIGRSYGASQAIHAAMVAKEKVSATIIYYPFGEVITGEKMLAAIKAPILGHFANDDYFFSPAKLSHLTSAMKNSGLTMTANMYKARHGFDNLTGKNFSEPAHTLSLSRTHHFLDKHLN